MVAHHAGHLERSKRAVTESARFVEDTDVATCAAAQRDVRKLPAPRATFLAGDVPKPADGQLYSANASFSLRHASELCELVVVVPQEFEPWATGLLHWQRCPSSHHIGSRQRNDRIEHLILWPPAKPQVADPAAASHGTG